MLVDGVCRNYVLLEGSSMLMDGVYRNYVEMSLSSFPAPLMSALSLELPKCVIVFST